MGYAEWNSEVVKINNNSSEKSPTRRQNKIVTWKNGINSIPDFWVNSLFALKYSLKILGVYTFSSANVKLNAADDIFWATS